MLLNISIFSRLVINIYLQSGETGHKGSIMLMSYYDLLIYQLPRFAYVHNRVSAVLAML